MSDSYFYNISFKIKFGEDYKLPYTIQDILNDFGILSSDSGLRLQEFNAKNIGNDSGEFYVELVHFVHNIKDPELFIKEFNEYVEDCLNYEENKGLEFSDIKISYIKVIRFETTIVTNSCKDILESVQKTIDNQEDRNFKLDYRKFSITAIIKHGFIVLNKDIVSDIFNSYYNKSI
jgi:hypothetical protein